MCAGESEYKQLKYYEAWSNGSYDDQIWNNIFRQMRSTNVVFF